MFRAKWGNFSTNRKICIFDILNVNKYMLKNSVFIMVSHCKDGNKSVYLTQFNSVIINITKFPFSGFANSLGVKGLQAIVSLFFMIKNSLY